MDQEKQEKSAAGAVEAGAKTGKAIANIAKGAASGGVPGAIGAAVLENKQLIIAAGALLLIPVLILAMLPSIIFGSFFGDGMTDSNAITDSAVLAGNMTDLNTSISKVLSDGLKDVLDRIDTDFSTSGCDSKEVNNPYGSNVVYNANTLISMYCAHKDTDIRSISKEDLEAILEAGKSHLYSFSFKDDVRDVPAKKEGEKATTTKVRVYTISYNGEGYFADKIFQLSEEQKSLSIQYASNLSLLLSDGVYQGLTDTEYSATGLSYEGVVFPSEGGSTRVVYYNQLDDRWKNAPYGTDNIGGYACGPTSMAIVVSSLSSDTVDPIQMAKWAYENGYWCSGSGSYHSLIPGAAKAWKLNVDGCTASEPQRIVDALSGGKLVVAIMTKGHFTSGGHFIVLRGVTSEGKILVADPASYTRSEKEWDLNIILNEASKRAGSGGPFWIIGK